MPCTVYVLYCSCVFICVLEVLFEILIVTFILFPGWVRLCRHLYIIVLLLICILLVMSTTVLAITCKSFCFLSLNIYDSSQPPLWFAPSMYITSPLWVVEDDPQDGVAG